MWRASRMMPKLMPLPTTIDDRNAVATLSSPIVRRVIANVTRVPTASDHDSAPTARTER